MKTVWIGLKGIVVESGSKKCNSGLQMAGFAVGWIVIRDVVRSRRVIDGVTGVTAARDPGMVEFCSQPGDPGLKVTLLAGARVIL